MPIQANDQDVIIARVNRALNYAHRKGVTLVAATGNENTDMANPGVDLTSPDYPAGTPTTRTIDNDNCVDLPAEGPHVLGVTSLGPSRQEVRLLQLHDRAAIRRGRAVGSGWLVPRRVRHADVPDQPEPDPLDAR